MVVRVEDARPEPFPAAYFFRDPSTMGAVDATALDLARGRVLDVGAGAGAHAVPLLARGLSVTALELIPEAVTILRARGVLDARAESVWTFSERTPFDTLLALMNGTGLAGTRGRLEPLLHRLADLVAPAGQLLLDSTDLGGEDDMGAVELHYQLEYGGGKGPPFPQLFVAEETLDAAARRTGWSLEVVAREGDRYLARLVRAS